MAIINAILPDGSLDDTEQAIRKLYAVADGNSKDLTNPARRAELLDELPDTVRRLAGRRRFEWATTEETERVRRAFIRAAEKREREERLGWSVDRFTRWLDGFYSLLRSRAEQGGYAFLARAVKVRGCSIAAACRSWRCFSVPLLGKNEPQTPLTPPKNLPDTFSAPDDEERMGVVVTRPAKRG